MRILLERELRQNNRANLLHSDVTQKQAEAQGKQFSLSLSFCLADARQKMPGRTPKWRERVREMDGERDFVARMIKVARRNVPLQANQQQFAPGHWLAPI